MAEHLTLDQGVPGSNPGASTKAADFRWPLRLAVRTPASHAGSTGSIPVGVTNPFQIALCLQPSVVQLRLRTKYARSSLSLVFATAQSEKDWGAKEMMSVLWMGGLCLLSGVGQLRLRT